MSTQIVLTKVRICNDLDFYENEPLKKIEFVEMWGFQGVVV